MNFTRIIFVSIILFFIGSMVVRHSIANVPDSSALFSGIEESCYSQLHETPSLVGYCSGCNTDFFINLLLIHSPYQSLQLCGRTNLNTFIACYLIGKVFLSFSMRGSSLSGILLKNSFPKIKLSCFPPCEYFVYALRKIVI